jgi:secreted trypsin-like serine protease
LFFLYLIGKRIPDELKMVILNSITDLECEKTYNARTQRKMKLGLLDTQMCAGHPSRDTCQGDSGGPLQIKLHYESKLVPFVVGITSFGPEPCGVDKPAIYTRVSSYIPWIESIVNETFDPMSIIIYILATKYAKINVCSFPRMFK